MLSNPVEEGGSISIIGSSSFNMNGNSIYELESGLDDLSTLLPISMTYNSGTFALRITNFAKYTEPTVISMLLQFTNPVDEGKTTPLVIRSLKADGVTVIDEDLRDAYAEILSYTSPLSVSVSYPGVKTNQATGAFTQIRITFSPQIEIPALGWVEVILPENFSTDSLTAPICTVKPTYMSVAAAKSCLVVGDKLNVQLFDDSTGVYGKFQSGVASYVDLSNIYAPRQSGWSIFDFSTYDNNRNVLESGTAVVNMITNVQTGFAVTTAHAGIDTPTVIMLT